jgi:hypothetical protein
VLLLLLLLLLSSSSSSAAAAAATATASSLKGKCCSKANLVILAAVYNIAYINNKNVTSFKVSTAFILRANTPQIVKKKARLSFETSGSVNSLT